MKKKPKKKRAPLVFPEPINDTPENVAKVFFQAPRKKAEPETSHQPDTPSGARSRAPYGYSGP